MRPQALRWLLFENVGTVQLARASRLGKIGAGEILKSPAFQGRAAGAGSALGPLLSDTRWDVLTIQSVMDLRQRAIR
jgi:hypothetical protein